MFKIKKFNLENRIHLIGYKNNIFNYMKNCQGFILSSLWEDPGFVLIEAAFFAEHLLLQVIVQMDPKRLLWMKIMDTFLRLEIKTIL